MIVYKLKHGLAAYCKSHGWRLNCFCHELELDCVIDIDRFFHQIYKECTNEKS